MTHCTYTPTPLSTTYPLPLTDGSPLGSEDSRNIKALLATFNTSHWHALSCFSVNKVWYLHAPSTTQWKTTKRILHYVKSILNTRITFWKSLSTLLSTFYDRLSGGGFSHSVFPILFIFIQNKPLFSRSSTMVEYKALCNVTTGLIWAKVLIWETGTSLTEKHDYGVLIMELNICLWILVSMPEPSMLKFTITLFMRGLPINC
jgi:hypothetical protein